MGEYNELLDGDPMMLDSPHFFTFVDLFIKSIRTLYNGSNSSVKRDTSPIFEINRGMRQVCPISPFLDLLTAQVLRLLVIPEFLYMY